MVIAGFTTKNPDSGLAQKGSLFILNYILIVIIY